MKLISWNVNGLRSILRKNFLDYLEAEAPDILCLQETKATPNDVEQLWPATFTTYWNSAQKPGYAGTAIFTKPRPINVFRGMNLADYDHEGRILGAEFEDFYLLNVYVPNSKSGLLRLPFRQSWDREFLKFLKGLELKKPVVLCGDLNVAHKEIDIAHPTRNIGNPGFTFEERAGFDDLVEAGFVDTFREFEKRGGFYTWWSPFSGARQKNTGWRIDYFLISPRLRPRLKSAFIRCDVPGSDHCPVGIELE